MSAGAATDARRASAGQKSVAIVQSSYIPWKGYFDLIAGVDEFVLFDDMQFTRRDWRNRNRIKSAAGLLWLTIPVQVKGRYFQRIDETRIADADWARRHWMTIQHAYARAPYFSLYKPVFEELYLGCNEEYLSRINYRFLAGICDLLGISTQITRSTQYATASGKTERLVSLCRQAGAARYLSGPSAQDYLDESLFHAAGMTVDYADYGGYPVYRQLAAPFEHRVSIIDLLFNEGPESRRYLLAGAVPNEVFGGGDA